MNILVATTGNLPGAPMLASVTIPTKHKWLFEVFGWKFGLVEFNIWGEVSTQVFVGPLDFSAGLSAPAVAAIAGGITVATLLGVVAITTKGVKQQR